MLSCLCHVCSLEDEAFKTQCGCLAQHLECGQACGCAQDGRCLNRAVTQRHALVIGKDVQEIDAWGMDCYTRRNIIDGMARVMVLEMGSTSSILPGSLCPLAMLPMPCRHLEEGWGAGSM